jgi:CRISPR system Cascade subunit CasA
MNLTTDPWIPIVWTNGQPATVGLCDAFARGEDIRDLAVRPHERIAVMRLLICIVQAALDGPADHDEWKVCRSKIVPTVLDYLKGWQKAFKLFGDGPRFLQVEGLKKPSDKDDNDEGKPVSKLDLALATGNNSTLFDNGDGSDRAFGSGHVALTLLTFQCFSPCGTIGVALWNGAPTLGWSSYPAVKRGQSKHAPCLPGNMLHSYLRGETFLESLQRNLMTREQIARFCGYNTWGKPIWEQMPSGPTDKTATKNATETYLGRLVPLSRAIRLEENCRSMILANGLDYPDYREGWREPSATIVTRPVKKQPTRLTLPAEIEKGIWRELHALTVIGVDKNTNGGPAALENLEEKEAFDMWVGGLIAEGNGKLLDTTESVFNIPPAMFGETSQRVYEEGVRHSERVEYRLRRAISTYRLAMETNERDLDGINRRLASLKKPEKDRMENLSAKAKAQFWTDIEQSVTQLLTVAANPEQLGMKNEWHKTVWVKAVWTAVRAAYEGACPHDTPRQMRAYALGLNALHYAPKKEEETES